MPNIHTTAIVDPTARLGDDVEVGAYCIIEADVEIGAGTLLRPYVLIRRYTTMGTGNYVDAHAVLGGEPQDYKFNTESKTYLRIGDDNVFREGVTISRATGEGNATIIGNGTYFMVGAHAGHNAVVADRAILVNFAAAAGHAEIGTGAILSAYSAIHQFCWMGEMAMMQGGTIMTMHLPPYVITAAPVNNVAGLNRVGLRRAEHISSEDRAQIKEAFRLTYRSGLSPAKALEQMDACTDWGEAADKFRRFVRRVITAEGPNRRGLCPMRPRSRTI